MPTATLVSPVHDDPAMPRGAGGDPIASHLDALAQHLAGDPVGETLLEGLRSHLDPAHPAAKARRVATYLAAPAPDPLPEHIRNPPPNYRLSDVAAALGVSKWWVWRRVRDGVIPSYRLGREYRITQATLDQLLGGAA